MSRLFNSWKPREGIGICLALLSIVALTAAVNLVPAGAAPDIKIAAFPDGVGTGHIAPTPDIASTFSTPVPESMLPKKTAKNEARTLIAAANSMPTPAWIATAIVAT